MDDPDPNTPSALWNGMIAPLLPMRFQLAIWYQGEANVGDPVAYKCKFPAMIMDWKRQFILTLPFFFVQLAPYSGGGPNWPRLQQAQLQALSTSANYATAMDLGDPTSPNGSIHPRDKQTVGKRLSLPILAKVYGQTGFIFSGPVAITSMVFSPNSTSIAILVGSGASGSGLYLSGTSNCGYNMSSDGCCESSPFEVGTEDGEWHRADFVTFQESPAFQVTAHVMKPPPGGRLVGLRHAWQDYPQCAVYNPAGLPMTPFNTSIAVYGDLPRKALRKRLRLSEE